MNRNNKSLVTALGAALALGGASAQAATLFQVADLGAGYMVAQAGSEKPADAKTAGAAKAAEAKPAATKAADAAKTADKAGAKKVEMACGEGKCGAMTAPKGK